METYAMQLPAHSFCADCNARGGLEVCAMHCAPQYLVTQLMAELL